MFVRLGLPFSDVIVDHDAYYWSIDFAALRAAYTSTDREQQEGNG